MAIKRLYSLPTQSSFLLGPRGTGKSTFVKEQIKPDLTINLLDSRQFLELKREPNLLEAKLGGLRPHSLVCIDEIQKIPILLDEVHRLIEEKKIKFILTGSSARKLKQGGANLLGGRALTQKMFPFSLTELRDSFSIKRLLEIGTLPVILGHADNHEDALLSYVDTYLKEEIKEEAITRSLDEFIRFFEISAQLNGRILNFENLGKETKKSGDTIKKWYSVLEDTFLGSMVSSFRPGFKVREVSHQKFYYFDAGVVRAAAGIIHEPLDALTIGFNLETMVLNELKIFNEVTRHKRNIYFYGSPGKGEVDFVIETEKKTMDRSGKFVLIECKSNKKWRREYENPSRDLAKYLGKKCAKMIGIYLGSEELVFDHFHVYPLATFVEKLHQGLLY